MTYWWQREDMFGHLQEILAHINHVRQGHFQRKPKYVGVFLWP